MYLCMYCTSYPPNTICRVDPLDTGSCHPCTCTCLEEFLYLKVSEPPFILYRIAGFQTAIYLG